MLLRFSRSVSTNLADHVRGECHTVTLINYVDESCRIREIACIAMLAVW